MRLLRSVAPQTRSGGGCSVRCSSAQRRSHPPALLPASTGPAPARVPHRVQEVSVTCHGTHQEDQGSEDFVEEFMLPSITSNEEFAKESRWVQRQVATWLNEEFTPLDVHADVGVAAAKAYCKLRAQGESEAGTVLLGLSSELLNFNFRETFTSAFEVSNKVMEMVMMRSGCEVCCTSPGDKERLMRVSQELEQTNP